MLLKHPQDFRIWKVKKLSCDMRFYYIHRIKYSLSWPVKITKWSKIELEPLDLAFVSWQHLGL
jgi:hypothetical protein